MERLEYIDRLKGLAILCVVIGHVYLYSYEQPEFIWARIIRSFHMPLFIFLSGFVSYKPNLVCWNINVLIRKLKRFLTPMLVIGSIFTIFQHASLNIHDVGISLIDFLKDPGKHGYWYLVSLSVFYVLLQLSRLNKKNNVIRETLIVIFVYCLLSLGRKLVLSNGMQFDPLCIFSCADFYPFFMLGYFSNKYHLVEYVNNHKWIAVSAFIGYILLFDRNLSIHFFDTLSERYIVRFCAIVFIISFFAYRNAKQSYIERGLAFVGRNSLEVYIYHYFIVCNVSLFVIRTFLESINNQLVIVLLSLLISLLISLPITYITIFVGKSLHRNTIVEKVVYGKF